MPPAAYFICAFALSVAFVASLVLTAGVRYAARRIGFVDRPDGGRKTQKQAVALGGGVAVALAAAGALTLVAVFSGLAGWKLFEDLTSLKRLALAAAAGLILALGLFDDVVALKGRYKLLGQILISGMLIAIGMKIEVVHLLGYKIDLGWAAAPFTLFWLLGAINAINLIDGIDGLAGSVGAVLCLTVAAIAFTQGHVSDMVIALSMAGALFGFLRFNFAPASVYLGDAGSMLVGLVIGALAIPVSAKSTLAISMITPVAVWSIPILDSAAAILRRRLTGQSVFSPDRGHLHHSLLQRGWTVRQTSLFITLICATTCVSAVLSVVWQNETIALLTVFAVVAYLVLTRTFGHVEYALVTNSFQQLPAAGGPGSANVTGRHRSIQLQGSREWNKLWAVIIESADDLGLGRVKLSINIPSLNEVFFAKWNSNLVKGDDENAWRVEQPLLVDGEKVGLLEISGKAENGSLTTPACIARAMKFLEPIEDDVRRIREQIRVERGDMQLGRPSQPSAAKDAGQAETAASQSTPAT